MIYNQNHNNLDLEFDESTNSCVTFSLVSAFLVLIPAVVLSVYIIHQLRVLRDNIDKMDPENTVDVVRKISRELSPNPHKWFLNKPKNNFQIDS